jgi:hypothetical protein
MKDETLFAGDRRSTPSSMVIPKPPAWVSALAELFNLAGIAICTETRREDRAGQDQDRV